jgi:hypothetical protein
MAVGLQAAGRLLAFQRLPGWSLRAQLQAGEGAPSLFPVLHERGQGLPHPQLRKWHSLPASHAARHPAAYPCRGLDSRGRSWNGERFSGRDGRIRPASSAGPGLVRCESRLLAVSWTGREKTGDEGRVIDEGRPFQQCRKLRA